MILKGNIKTIRFSSDEERQINVFLSGHPFIKSFSTLVRAALWEFIGSTSQKSATAKRPSFLWDYDLSEGQIREILRGPQKNRLWLVAKILEHARWEEVWEYLTLEQIRKDLPYLKLNAKTRRHWEDALQQWKRSA